MTARNPETRSYVDDKMDIVFFWKQNDTGIYGRRQDMLVKYLSKDPRVHRILHFDPPINIFQSGKATVKAGQVGRHSHARLIFYQTLRRKFRLEDTEKIRYDTFIFITKCRIPKFMKWILPSERDYLDYLKWVFRRHKLGERRTIFWVCPNNIHFPSIEHRFKSDLVIADVIDDQRKWNINSKKKEELQRNYRDILARSHLVFANCQNVMDSMQEFTSNIHIVPNAAEILESEARHWKKPAELRCLQGPVIGYVGTLDTARIDLDLLTSVAIKRPEWNLTFIGSMHMGKEIKKLNKFKNVHFLGVRTYDQAIRYIRYFDVAMIPHLDNELTRHMNPLKLYVYLSLHVPIVTTPIANIGDFAEFIQIGRTPEEFIQKIAYCLDENPVSVNLERIRRLLQANCWDERVARILGLIEAEFTGNRTDRASTITLVSTTDEKNGYIDRCTVCGHAGYLKRKKSIASIRENYQCSICKASLRYREQARLIVKHFSREGSEYLAELVHESEFRELKIYEPGLMGPFRNILQDLLNYHISYFWDNVEPGEFQKIRYQHLMNPRYFRIYLKNHKFRKGIQCQDLMNLTYEDQSFDLVLSSDIFEHVRQPFVGFKEVNRVLKPGGVHIFTIPLQNPMPSRTIFRVDTSGTEDVPILPMRFHGEPLTGKSLVYTDFGADMVEIMAADGIDLRIESPCSTRSLLHISNRMLTFFWRKANDHQRI